MLRGLHRSSDGSDEVGERHEEPGVQLDEGHIASGRGDGQLNEGLIASGRGDGQLIKGSSPPVEATANSSKGSSTPVEEKSDSTKGSSPLVEAKANSAQANSSPPVEAKAKPVSKKGEASSRPTSTASPYFVDGSSHDPETLRPNRTSEGGAPATSHRGP